MNTIFIIEKLYISVMENDYSEAATYKSIGFVNTLDEASSVVEKMGSYDGVGWPVSRGKSLPNGRYSSIEELQRFK